MASPCRSRTTIMLLLLFVAAEFIDSVSSVTDPQDAAVLHSLNNGWTNTPPSWGNSTDPCGSGWEGVACNDNDRVTELRLSSMGLQGTLTDDIGLLTQLTILDLSFNTGLTGSLPAALGNLTNLTILILQGCSFSGHIPDELGYLAGLSFLALNSNNFNGSIPASLGRLSNLYWLDLAGNQLTGSLPVSTASTPGLDLLSNAKHFHLHDNLLTGEIPEKLFNSNMALTHVLLNGNWLSGPIPSTLGLMQSLEILRLDGNFLTGPVPSNINNLTSLNGLQLQKNFLSGPVPDLTAMNALNYVDLSNNSFDASIIPEWFTSIPSLTSIIMECGKLEGPIPKSLFTMPQLQEVKLRNNSLNGTLYIANYTSQLQLIDLKNNQISAITLSTQYPNSLELVGNPVCEQLPNLKFCQTPNQSGIPYSTSLANCGGKTCPADQKLSPGNCECAYPYQGNLTFRAPSFQDLSNSTIFQALELRLWTALALSPHSVSLQNPFFNADRYLQVDLQLFPSSGKYFNSTTILRIGHELANQTFKPPPEFGPYYFVALPYTFSPPGARGGARR